MQTFLKWTGLVLLLVVVVYLFGPIRSLPAITDEKLSLSMDLLQLEAEISQSEKKVALKPDNEARIIWADSTQRKKTPYSIVYIPGFGASWAEGDPVNKQIARRFGCNLYLSRLAEHSLASPDALQGLTPATYAASAEQALAIGRALGDKVIVMGTSAGGMLALYLAAKHPDISGLVLYSPCIAVNNPAIRLITKPWGKQILDQVMGSEHVTITHYKPDRANYWLTRYHTNGLITLQTMLETYMTPATFERVKQPLFLGYYYKDEEHQDKVVSVAAMLDMFEELGTPPAKKRKVAFPKSGDHVIASHFTSHDLAGVSRETERFLRDVLNMQPVPTSQSVLVFQQKK